MEEKNIIFGRNPVLEYIRNASNGDNFELFLSKKAHGKIIGIIINECMGKKIPVTYKEKDFFSKIGASSKHQGVALRVPRAIKKIPDKNLLKTTADKNGILVLLDQITDPHNAGSIIRTAEALGGDGIVLPGANSAGLGPSVIKSSAGATAYINIITVPNVSSFLDRAKKAGFWIIGTGFHGKTEISELKKIRPAIVIIGSEGKGMRRLTEEKCDFIVSIPLRGKVSSLNASVAAGIVLYEIMKA